jgi:hypothetical protein
VQESISLSWGSFWTFLSAVAPTLNVCRGSKIDNFPLVLSNSSPCIGRLTIDGTWFRLECVMQLRSCVNHDYSPQRVLPGVKNPWNVDTYCLCAYSKTLLMVQYWSYNWLSSGRVQDPRRSATTGSCAYLRYRSVVLRWPIRARGRRRGVRVPWSSGLTGAATSVVRVDGPVTGA